MVFALCTQRTMVKYLQLTLITDMPLAPVKVKKLIIK